MCVIFLAGVHGVGKGFLGAPVAKSLEIDHFTASQLIRDEKGCATWGTDKRATDLDDNQSALIRAVSKKRETGEDFLLDGHFVLRGVSGELIQLASDVFSDLQLSGVILLTDNIEVIADRLTVRDGIVVDPKSVAELAAAESAHGRLVCDALKIPLVILHSTNMQSLTDAVIQLLGR